jgi:hypothetical protein
VLRQCFLGTFRATIQRIPSRDNLRLKTVGVHGYLKAFAPPPGTGAATPVNMRNYLVAAFDQMSNQQWSTEVVVIADAIDRLGFQMPADDNLDIIGRPNEDHPCDSLSDEVSNCSFGGIVRCAVNGENDTKTLRPGSPVNCFRQMSKVGIEDVGDHDTYGTREIAHREGKVKVRLRYLSGECS